MKKHIFLIGLVLFLFSCTDKYKRVDLESMKANYIKRLEMRIEN